MVDVQGYGCPLLLVLCCSSFVTLVEVMAVPYFFTDKDRLDRRSFFVNVTCLTHERCIDISHLQWLDN